MNDNQGRDLGHWLRVVQADDLPAVHTFVTGLAQVLDAIATGLSLRHSSGTVAGRPQPQDQDTEAPDIGPRQLRPAQQTGPPHRARPIMIAISVALRGRARKHADNPLSGSGGTPLSTLANAERPQTATSWLASIPNSTGRSSVASDGTPPHSDVRVGGLLAQDPHPLAEHPAPRIAPHASRHSRGPRTQRSPLER